MAHWNTEKIISEISEFCYEVKSFSPGGDHDTANIQIQPLKNYKLFEDDYYFFVCGFTDNRCLNDSEWNEVDVPYIQIKDGFDSYIPLNSTNEKVVLCYNNLKKYFEDKGFIVVNNIKDFFFK